ncbi:MAG: S41 family peptidase [Rikenellaceae bacterium]|nr:S41 family peptidase [Rikenellaceae bacterium]MCL2691958.1 S41 family peptidase [Rikenellaceae bacterium]
MNKNTFRSIFFTLLFAAAGLLGVLLGSYFARPTSPGLRLITRTGIPAGPEGKVTQLLQMIRSSYIDPVDFDSIAEQLMPAIMEHLDPHSIYIPAQRYDAMNEALLGGFGGIGIKFNMITDTALVLNVISGGPSERAGVQSGDRILAVDSIPIVRMHQDEVMRLLRGEQGSKVELSLLRPVTAERFPLTITRGQVPVHSVTAAFEIEPGVAFIRLDQFSRTSYPEITSALGAMRSEGVDRVIFDLRGNQGGYLDQAIMIANAFLPENTMIVYTEDRDGHRVEQFSDGRGQFQDMQVVVLIDEGSASSSEILAGAIQDNDRGLIIGRRSFGKGLVQEQVQFADGSAVRLTIARYFTPTGRSIQKPYTGGTDDYYMELFERYMHHEYFVADSIRFADSLRFTTPGGRTVFGGGGIMPDIFVPYDTTYVNSFFVSVLAPPANVLYRFALRYADEHRTRINAVRSVAALNELLDADTGLLDRFLVFAASGGIRPTREELEQSREMLLARLRAQIGQFTPLDDVGYYSNIFRADNTVARALEALR